MCITGYEIVSNSVTVNGHKSAGQAEVSVSAPSGKKVISAFGENAVSVVITGDGSSCTFLVNSPEIDEGSSWTSPAQSVVCANVYECQGV